MNEEDQFLEQLMSDDSALDQWIERLSETPSEYSNSDYEEHHVVDLKKRKYEWKTTSHQQNENDNDKVSKRGHRRRGQFTLSIPRILKSDLRRKLVSMYENVMNSYDYHLISGFFQEFFVPNVCFDTKDIFTSTTKNVTMLEGVQPVLCYFLLLLQMCPDKITRVSEIQLKQSLYDIERTEIAFKFKVKNTMLYRASPLHLIKSIQNDLKELCGRNNTEEELLSITKRKRKFEHCVNEGEERHRSLLDPISGVFLKSRFELFDRPIENEVEGSMSFIVNKEKKIEKIIFSIAERVRLSNHDLQHLPKEPLPQHFSLFFDVSS